MGEVGRQSSCRGERSSSSVREGAAEDRREGARSRKRSHWYKQVVLPWLRTSITMWGCLGQVPLDNTGTRIYSWQNQRSYLMVAYPPLSVWGIIAVHSPGSLQGDVNGQRLCPGAGSAAGSRRFVKASSPSRSAHQTHHICTPSYTSEALNQQQSLTRVSQPLLSLAEAQER